LINKYLPIGAEGAIRRQGNGQAQAEKQSSDHLVHLVFLPYSAAV
jgi:hypothetical protein